MSTKRLPQPTRPRLTPAQITLLSQFQPGERAGFACPSAAQRKTIKALESKGLITLEYEPLENGRRYLYITRTTG